MQKITGKRFGILMTASLVIILAMGFYYFHIQSVKEAKVKEQAFKTLYRYAGDLKEKEREIAISHSYKNQEIIDIENKQSEIEEQYNQLNSEFFNKYKEDYYTGIDSVIRKSDSIDKNLKDKIETYKQEFEDLDKRCLELNKRYERFEMYKKQLYMVKKKNNKNTIKNNRVSKSDSINNLYYRNTEIYAFDLIDDRNDSIFPVKKKDIFPDVLEKDFFSGFIVFNSKEVIYNQFPHTTLELKQKKNKQSVRVDSLLNIFKTKDGIEISLDGGSKKFGIENQYELEVPIILKGEAYQLFAVKVDGIKVKYLAGLLPESKFESLKRGFDRALISAITIFVLLLLFSIPVIKLFVVAPGETYTIKNLVTLVISSVGLVFIIAYFLLHHGNLKYIKAHIKADGGHLNQIAINISNSFNIELNGLLRNLSQFDTVYSKYLKTEGNDVNSLYRDSIYNKLDIFTKDSLSWLDIFIAKTNKVRKGKEVNSPNYGETFGSIHNNYRYTDKPQSDSIDITSREYFQKQDYFNKDGFKFGLQSIFSLTTAKPQIVISTKINSISYLACLAAELTSVSNTILPQGYSFCIIDRNGKVWFHKDVKNNIRENLFTETDDHPNLIAAVKSHRKDVFKANYKMKPIIMRVEPMNTDLDLFIVTMCDLNNYAQIVNHSGYIIIAGFILIVLFWIVCTWIFRAWRKFKLGINNPPHTLLSFFPIKHKSERYISLVLLNGVMILIWLIAVLTLFKHIYVIHWISLLALTGASSILSQICFLWRIDRCDFSGKLFLKWGGLSIILLGLVELMPPKHCYISISFLSSITALIVFNLILYIFLKDDGKWLYALKNKISNVVGTLLKPFIKFEYKYYFYIYTLLLLFVLVPLVVLYTTIYHQETTLYYTAQQRYVADQIVNRRAELKKGFNKESIIPHLEEKGKYYEKFHEMKLVTIACKKCNNQDYSTGCCHEFIGSDNDIDSCNFKRDILKSTFNYVHFFGHARANIFFINNLIEDRGNRVKASYINSDDTTKHYLYFVEGNTLNLQVKAGGLPPNSNLFVLRMNKPMLKDFGKRYLGLLYGLIVITILFFYYLPLIATKYLFPQFKYTKQLFTKKQSQNQLHDLKEGEHKYIVTMPDRAFYERCIQNESTKLYRMHLPQGMSGFKSDDNKNKHVYLFIDHISFKGVNRLEEFVNYLEAVLETKAFLSINIVCFKVPVVLIQYFRDSMISKLRKNNKKTAKKRVQLETTLKRLVNCLSYFSVSYVPIMEQPIKDKILNEMEGFKSKWQDEFTHDKSIVGDTKENLWKKNIDWINAEIGSNATLIDKYKFFMRQDSLSENEYVWHDEKKDYTKKRIVTEENVYQAYLINRTYYQKIWDSCNEEEKSILYDIAEDYVINLHKKGVVNILINKGLIINGQFLKLFNLSFNYFVSRQIEEVDAINADLREHGKNGWSQYGLPLKLLGIAIVVFLIVTQQEFLSGIQSILISAGAILTFALRFFNFPMRGGS